MYDNGELYFRLEPLGVSSYPFDTETLMYITHLLYQLLHIYKIYKIYKLKHKKRSDMFRS